MKRIILSISIAALTTFGLYAQVPTQQQQSQELKNYMQKQEQELQAAIRSQTQRYTSEAAERMRVRKNEVREELEERRAQLMYRPEGMAPLRIK